MVQKMLVALSAPSHYLNQCWNIVNLNLRNTLPWNLKQNSKISIKKNAFEKVVCKMAAIRYWPQCVNSLWPSDAIWQHRTGSTLAQVMACCLIAPCHYLIQCWLIISDGPCHSSDDVIIRGSKDGNQLNKIENCIFKITSKSHRDQWVNTVHTLHTVSVSGQGQETGTTFNGH